MQRGSPAGKSAARTTASPNVGAPFFVSASQAVAASLPGAPPGDAGAARLIDRRLLPCIVLRPSHERENPEEDQRDKRHDTKNGNPGRNTGAGKYFS
jgi:hypothetical protein